VLVSFSGWVRGLSFYIWQAGGPCASRRTAGSDTALRVLGPLRLTGVDLPRLLRWGLAPGPACRSPQESAGWPGHTAGGWIDRAGVVFDGRACREKWWQRRDVRGQE